ncbi:cuticle protein 16.8 [Galendromus occidentalis]|uniref:Cuticle protein 16.8 n=1 Tax=Galendromus occidentalis TaxID=34638 RepID=A0AAJ7PAP3_9ACAR|nr:cuticle protein 16.8 [Galendromus occidentalis]
MLKSIALVALVGSAACQVQLRADEISQGRNTLYRGAVLANQQANYGPPRPYEYGYQLDDSNGSHGHAEKRDENGRVEGEYSINLGDGRVRVVKYVADENGYRADVSTDELGTESKNPNDVYIGSTAISGYEAALRYGPFAPPHVEQPLVVAERPQVQAINSQVALPTYGTFAGGQNAANRQQRQG